MKQSTSFAQVATNQFDYLSSALCANTPPCKKHSSSRKFLTLSISLRLLLVLFLTLTVTTNVWGETILFHETFGSNSSSARVWSDTYSVKSGISSVYSDAAYIMTNLKQSKNTVGCTESGLVQTTTGTDASIEIGPLNVANYENMKLSFMYKAGSVKGTYKRSAQYKISSNDTWKNLTVSGSQEASSCNEQTATLPETAEGIETLYIKIIFNTSNTQATVDEVELVGTEKITCDKKVTITKASATGGSFKVRQGSASGTEISSGGKIDNCDADVVVVVVPSANSNYTCTAVTATNSTSISGADANGNYTVTYAKGSNISSSITVTFTENQKYTVTWMVDKEESSTEDVYENGKVSSVPTVKELPCGDKFVGWTTDPITTPQDNAPTVFTTVAGSPTITKATTFYAVFADYKQ